MQHAETDGPGTAGIELRRDARLGPDVLAMIAESEAELAAIYRPEVRSAFSPTQLLDAGVVFVTAHLDGRVVGCGGMVRRRCRERVVDRHGKGALTSDGEAAGLA